MWPTAAMGVRYLWELLKECSETTPLRGLAGLTLAVDLSVWIMEGRLSAVLLFYVSLSAGSGFDCTLRCLHRSCQRLRPRRPQCGGWQSGRLRLAGASKFVLSRAESHSTRYDYILSVGSVRACDEAYI